MNFVHFFDPEKNRDLLKHGRLFISIGFGFALINLIIAVMPNGINWGIDFSGGTEMQIKFEQPVTGEQIRKILKDQGFEKHQVQQYGAETDNEWLARVERMTILGEDKVADLDKAIDAGLGEDARVEFRASEGDRFFVFVKDPAVKAADGTDDVVAEQKLLDEKQAKLAAAIEGPAGLHLRRTRASEGAQETTADAIVRDEPYRGEVRYLVQLQGVSDKLTRALTDQLGKLEVRRVDFVDATVAQSLKTDGVMALIISLALIMIYVALRFDVYFAPGAIIALIADPIGALSVYTMGRLEFDLPSIAGLLTVVGYSISHTIVIYDRVRETMPPSTTPLPHDVVAAVVNRAVNDTLNRTVNTTITVLFTTVSVWIFAGGSVRAFAANLTIGCIIGAYSSILMAPSIYLYFRKTFFNPAATKEEGISRQDRERGVV